MVDNSKIRREIKIRNNNIEKKKKKRNRLYSYVLVRGNFTCKLKSILYISRGGEEKGYRTYDWKKILRYSTRR